MGQGGHFYFNLISVYDENSWRIACETSVPNMRMVQLYVKMHPITDNQFFMGNEPGSSNAFEIGSQSVQIPIGCSQPEQSIRNPSPININENVERDIDDDGDSDDDESDGEEYVVEHGDSEDSSSEDIDGQLGVDDDDGDEIVDTAVTRREQFNPFIGLGENHPTRSMHDTSNFVPADYSLYGPRVSVDGPFAEKQTFNSKEHLIFNLSKWHIEKNREFVVVESSTTKYIVRCKDSNSEWRLYARAVGNCLP